MSFFTIISPRADHFYRPYMPGQPLNVLGVNDAKLTEMITLQTEPST
jgi:hypothetical protein